MRNVNVAALLQYSPYAYRVLRNNFYTLFAVAEHPGRTPVPNNTRNVSTESKRNEGCGRSDNSALDFTNSKRNRVIRCFANSQTGTMKPLSSANCRKIQRLLIGGWDVSCLGTIFACPLHAIFCTENHHHFFTSRIQEPGKSQHFLSVPNC